MNSPDRSAVTPNRLRLAAKATVGFAAASAIIYFAKFAPVKVAAFPVTQGEIVAEVMGTGTLEARVTTSISPKISGRIAALHADQGDRVQTGDVLLSLDDEELQQQVAIAEANSAARRAAIERLKSDKQRTTAILAQSQKEFERQQTLVSSNASSVTELDKARETLAVSQAGLANAEAAMGEAQAELVAAERSLEYHRTLLSNAHITAPFDGLIVARNREPGDVVVPGSSILTLISTDELWINAWVDETEMSRLASGQPATVFFRSESDQSFPGKVARLGRQADRETREFVVDVTVLELPENWAVGQRADVYIEVNRKDSTLTIPADAIVWRGEDVSTREDNSPGVFINDDGRASWRQIDAPRSQQV